MFDTPGPSSASASMPADFSRFIDTTPVTAHPRLPLETVMEIFRKIGPRVILVEHHGRLAGLVTVKDCLKYQFKVEAAESPRAEEETNQHQLEESQQERLWELMRRAAGWVSDKVSSASGGRIRLSDDDRAGSGGGRGFTATAASSGAQRSRARAGSGGGGGGYGQIMDGTEDLLDSDSDDGVELQVR